MEPVDRESAASPSSRTPGTSVGGRYTLLRRIGQGGVGSVWAARDEQLRTTIAVKIVGRSASSEEVVARFEREATALAKIGSEHVVTVLDHGVDAVEGPFIVLEMLAGEDLGKKLERDGPMSIRETCRMVVEALRGLSVAHAAGIIHRDVKPENLFLVEKGGGWTVKLVDFGIAKLDAEGSRQLTTNGELLGTLEYMSPEVLLARPQLDARADLYALAAVAYRAITGVPPHQADGIGEMLLALTTTDVEPPSKRRAGVWPELDAWFEKALAHEPEERFATARDMAKALRDAYVARPAPQSPSRVPSAAPLAPSVAPDAESSSAPLAPSESPSAMRRIASIEAPMPEVRGRGGPPFAFVALLGVAALVAIALAVAIHYA